MAICRFVFMDSMHISFGSMASQSKLALIKSLSDVVESVMPLIQCALTSLAKMVQIAGWCATTGSSISRVQGSLVCMGWLNSLGIGLMHFFK